MKNILWIERKEVAIQRSRDGTAAFLFCFSRLLIAWRSIGIHNKNPFGDNRFEVRVSWNLIDWSRCVRPQEKRLRCERWWDHMTLVPIFHTADARKCRSEWRTTAAVLFAQLRHPVSLWRTVWNHFSPRWRSNQRCARRAPKPKDPKTGSFSFRTFVRSTIKINSKEESPLQQRRPRQESKLLNEVSAATNEWIWAKEGTGEKAHAVNAGTVILDFCKVKMVFRFFSAF